MSAFSGRREILSAHDSQMLTAISNESVASQIQNLQKRDKECDSPYLSKNETQNNEICDSLSISIPPPPFFFQVRHLTKLSIARII